MGTTKTAAAVLQSEKSGSSARLSRTAGLETMPPRPPTWGSFRANQAAAIEPTMEMTKSSRSVTTTPQSPDVAE
jgi:hypothetical protein